MRGAVRAGEGVSPALLQSCLAAEPLSQSAIKALLHFVARECHWSIDDFDWRVVHRTYHACTIENAGRHFTALIGADAPVLALATSRPSGGWSFFDDAAAAHAVAAYYGPSVRILLAQQLNHDLTEKDRTWLAEFGPRMKYDLKYWNPQTVGEVVFNFWD